MHVYLISNSRFYIYKKIISSRYIVWKKKTMCIL
jgi:hypothetical protein